MRLEKGLSRYTPTNSWVWGVEEDECARCVQQDRELGWVFALVDSIACLRGCAGSLRCYGVMAGVLLTPPVVFESLLHGVSGG